MLDIFTITRGVNNQNFPAIQSWFLFKTLSWNNLSIAFKIGKTYLFLGCPLFFLAIFPEGWGWKYHQQNYPYSKRVCLKIIQIHTFDDLYLPFPPEVRLGKVRWHFLVWVIIVSSRCSAFFFFKQNPSAKCSGLKNILQYLFCPRLSQASPITLKL